MVQVAYNSFMNLYKHIPVHRLSIRVFLLVIFLVVLQFQLNAIVIIDKSADSRPRWINDVPKGKSFEYYMGMSTNKVSLEDAKEIAISDAISGLAMKNEIVIEGAITTIDTEINSALLSSVTKEINLFGKSDKISGLAKEEDYWEVSNIDSNITYRYWVLMRVPKNSARLNQNIFSQQGYGITPVLKSLIIPGWGQIHKGQLVKGVALLSGIAFTSTVGFITLNLSNGYKKDASNSHDPEWVDYYNKMSDQYFYVSLSSLIIASSLYGYNVFDVVSSKGAKIYSEQEKHKLNICFLPLQRNIINVSYKF